jgi:hypothetical protein
MAGLIHLALLRYSVKRRQLQLWADWLDTWWREALPPASVEEGASQPASLKPPSAQVVAKFKKVLMNLPREVQPTLQFMVGSRQRRELIAVLPHLTTLIQSVLPLAQPPMAAIHAQQATLSQSSVTANVGILTAIIIERALPSPRMSSHVVSVVRANPQPQVVSAVFKPKSLLQTVREIVWPPAIPQPANWAECLTGDQLVKLLLADPIRWETIKEIITPPRFWQIFKDDYAKKLTPWHWLRLINFSPYREKIVQVLKVNPALGTTLNQYLDHNMANVPDIIEKPWLPQRRLAVLTALKKILSSRVYERLFVKTKPQPAPGLQLEAKNSPSIIVSETQSEAVHGSLNTSRVSNLQSLPHPASAKVPPSVTEALQGPQTLEPSIVPLFSSRSSGSEINTVETQRSLSVENKDPSTYITPRSNNYAHHSVTPASSVFTPDRQLLIPTPSHTEVVQSSIAPSLSTEYLKLHEAIGPSISAQKPEERVSPEVLEEEKASRVYFNEGLEERNETYRKEKYVNLMKKGRNLFTKLEEAFGNSPGAIALGADTASHASSVFSLIPKSNPDSVYTGANMATGNPEINKAASSVFTGIVQPQTKDDYDTHASSHFSLVAGPEQTAVLSVSPKQKMVVAQLASAPSSAFSGNHSPQISGKRLFENTSMPGVLEEKQLFPDLTSHPASSPSPVSSVFSNSAAHSAAPASSTHSKRTNTPTSISQGRSPSFTAQIGCNSVRKCSEKPVSLILNSPIVTSLA